MKDFDATRRPLAAVCHGPQLLLSAGLVKGRTLTAWKTVLDANGGSDQGDVFFPLTATDFTPYIQQLMSKSANYGGAYAAIGARSLI